MGTDLVYVSGRKRKPGEMNGKSCNLNNCLSQIYPEGVPIPAHELVCIFDADQVANVDFFTKMIPLFDAGDDVGMVLSPQCFHNVNVGADIFNHCNINFWEYAQHGYDAFGFISCTGTNFLTRSAAFEQAGWSPEYTLTEDYALGMELTKRKWYCRYVEEYLAIGEAPEQVRNCFQQRSRWCKVRASLLYCAVMRLNSKMPAGPLRLCSLLAVLKFAGCVVYCSELHSSLGSIIPVLISLPAVRLAGVSHRTALSNK